MNDLRARVDAALAGRYRLRRELGTGGMASVFAAEDLKHHREVAIKVLSPELAAAIGPERFVRELETVGRLTHPHILPMFDSGTADGLPYFVMPVVAGESLRAHLERERQLGVDEAVRLAREVADALAYAHAHHVVHRDVKPENILLSGGHALLADFGVAHAVEGAGGERLTATGMVLGTPLYMSPEQASGGRAIDGRSDQYALACVVYEMLAGSPPFTGPTAESLIHQHLSLAPRRVTDVRPGVPARVAQALERALAKVPGDRFASCAEFAAALAEDGPDVTVATPPTGLATSRPLPPTATASGPTIAMSRRKGRPTVRNLALLALALVAGVLGMRALLSERAASGIHSLAVLPLENLSGDESQQYFADGMTEELTAELSGIQALRVISRTSAMGYRGTRKRLPQIARELGVDAVVEGSVRREGGEVLVTAQLVNARQDRHLWGDRYVRKLSDVLSLQGELARTIAREVRVRLTPAERARLSRRRVVEPEAHEAYLRGRYLLRGMSESNCRQALGYFETAVRLDSSYAEAWSGIADVWYGFSSLYVPAREAMPRVKQAAERALALDPDLAQAHASLGAYLGYYEWQWQAAEAEFRRAVELDANDAWTRFLLAQLLGLQRRFPESQAQWDRAVDLDPLSLYFRVGAANSSLFDGRVNDAVAGYRAVTASDSGYAIAFTMLGQALLVGGRTQEALVAFRKAVAEDDSPFVRAMLGTGLAHAGRVQEAEAILTALRASAARNVQSLHLAMIEAALGRKKVAFDHLEASLERRDEEILWLAVSPLWIPLRSDPRFARLLDRLGLPYPPGTTSSQ